MEVIDRLLELTAKRFKKPKESLKPEDDFFEVLDIDSLQALELLSELEREFNVQVPDYEMQKVRSFQQLALLIKKKL